MLAYRRSKGRTQILPNTGPPLSKRHHVVPRMLLKRFVDDLGWLHAYTRTQPARGVYRSRPENLMVETHRYSEIGDDGRRRPIVEGRLALLESAAEQVIDKIIGAARTGRTPLLDATELDIWYLFLTIQWKRVPDLHLEVNTDAEAQALFARIITDARQRYPQFRDKLDQFEEPPMRARLIHNARVGSLSVSPDIMDALRSRGVGIARIGRPGKQFVLGSRPVVKLTQPGKTHIRHPECEVWLAVAPDIALGLGRGPATVTTVSIGADDVRHLNLASAGQSTTICGASPTLIGSLARPR